LQYVKIKTEKERWTGAFLFMETNLAGADKIKTDA
jgi:hypothetical protein